MAYNSSTSGNAKRYKINKNLRLENTLTNDRKPVKIGDDSTGLLLAGSDVYIEGNSEIGGNLSITGEVDLLTPSIAGMIIGYTRIQNTDSTSSDNEIGLDTTMTVLQSANGSDVSITFNAPPSGKNCIFSNGVWK